MDNATENGTDTSTDLVFMPEPDDLSLDKRSKNMVEGKIKKYGRGHVYILDHPGETATAGRKRKRQTEHQFNCDLVKSFFDTYTSYDVHPITFPEGTGKKEFRKFWAEELASKTHDDLLIFYFHGSAFDEDEAWSWKFNCSLSKIINAYEFIETINKSNADAMLLLDCYIQTRFSRRWVRMNGTTEIIARPEIMMSSVRDQKDDALGFTEGIFGAMTYLIEDLQAEKRKDEAKSAKAQKAGSREKEPNMSRALRSMPQVLASFTSVYSNPIRLWLDKPKGGDTKTIKRLKVDPNLIKVTGKLEFFAETIQGGGHPDSDSDDGESTF